MVPKTRFKASRRVVGEDGCVEWRSRSQERRCWFILAASSWWTKQELGDAVLHGGERATLPRDIPSLHLHCQGWSAGGLGSM